MNDDEKSKPPKTKATKQAVFDYCDLLAAQGFRGDFYKELAKYFGAGQGTVGPHFQAWKAGRPNPGEWMMTEAAQAIVQGRIQIRSATPVDSVNEGGVLRTVDQQLSVHSQR